MDEYKLEQINQLNKRKEKFADDTVDKIVDAIADHLREAIEWDLDGNVFVNNDDEYHELVSDIFTKTVDKLKEYNS